MKQYLTDIAFSLNILSIVGMGLSGVILFIVLVGNADRRSLQDWPDLAKVMTYYGVMLLGISVLGFIFIPSGEAIAEMIK